MELLQCKHIRVRDNNDYNMDIEEFIKLIEMQFKIDFTSLPQWKELIEMMHIVQTDYKMKLNSAANRKYQILKNIFTQNSRPTPFELTEKLARTSKLWRDMNLNLKKSKTYKVKDQPSAICSDGINSMQGIVGEAFTSPTNESQPHPNTEEEQSNQHIEIRDIERPDTEIELKSPHLPINICTNLHKMVSSLGSNYMPLISSEIDLKSTELMSYRLIDNAKDQLLKTQSKLVNINPNKIFITKDTTKKQSMKLYMTNCCTEYLHLKFKNISDNSYFKSVKIIPYTPIKLYPGLAVAFKFTYALKFKNNDVKSSIQFRVSRNVLSETSEDVISIPIESSFIKSRRIQVTEAVYIPPNYSWQVTSKYGNPKAVVHIKNSDDAYYYLHIRKRIVDFTRESGESVKSVDVISPDTESLVERLEDKDLEHHSTMLSTPNTNPVISSHFDELDDDDNSLVNSTDIVGLVLIDIIDLAFEPFILKHTFLRIPPCSRKFVIVYFTKMHHVGCHQSYYDLTFNDCEDDDITICKTTKVFAEVMPHPISLQPKILDMSKSPIIFGYLEDSFTITNSHKVFPVTIKIKTTTKMKKIFNIIPMEAVVPAQRNANFNVRICARKNKETIESDDFAYFTIKIVIIGHKSVYENVPPIYYEIITPCASEFKKVYGSKYFRDIVDSSERHSSDIKRP